jgi:hypothetical protein
MASDREFVEYVAGQIAADAGITYRKMFGEYMLYANGKPAVLICDNTAYIKTLDCVKPYLGNAERGVPDKNAKDHYLIDPADRELWSAVVKELERNVPLPKPKKAV